MLNLWLTKNKSSELFTSVISVQLLWSAQGLCLSTMLTFCHPQYYASCSNCLSHIFSSHVHATTSRSAYLKLTALIPLKLLQLTLFPATVSCVTNVPITNTYCKAFLPLTHAWNKKGSCRACHTHSSTALIQCAIFMASQTWCIEFYFWNSISKPPQFPSTRMREFQKWNASCLACRKDGKLLP